VKEMGLAHRAPLRLRADASRVIACLFIPGQELVGGSESRGSVAVERVMALEEDEVTEVLAELMSRFGNRHRDLDQVFSAHAARVTGLVKTPMTDNQRQLLGAVFTNEYALEGAAICNPSIVAAPDQQSAAPGELNIVMSYRCVGEGHLSSINFRSGTIDAVGVLTIDDAARFPETARISDGMLECDVFHGRLRDLGLDGETAAYVLDDLPPTFSRSELEAGIAHLTTETDIRLNVADTTARLRLFADNFYVATFASDLSISQRVLWPATARERNGMEDARFVEMRVAGQPRYVATYTAFDGQSVSQQLLATNDFRVFTSTPLVGLGAMNKGMALFPRKINGQFVALSRHDRESNAIAFSHNLHQWESVERVQLPSKSWELIQIGNCGSPLELDEGWLVITHGTGPMRSYGLGAMLLDLDDPRRILAELPRPLLFPNESERDGYVPNVVYSCGSLLRDRTLYVPYGMADQAISYFTVNIDELIAAMGPLPPSDD